MTDRWLFVAVRRRDRYSTIAAVPKSEYPDLASALKRVESEFAHDTWKITAVSPHIRIERAMSRMTDQSPASPSSDPRPDPLTHPEYWTE